MAYTSRFNDFELKVILDGCRPFHDELVRELALDLVEALAQVEHLQDEVNKWVNLTMEGERVRSSTTLQLLLHLPLVKNTESDPTETSGT